MMIELTKPNLVYIFFRRKAVINWVAGALIVIALAYCIFATPIYEAKASLVVNFSSAPAVLSTGGNQNAVPVTPLDHEEIINTNIFELESEHLARAVISEIGPEKIYPHKFSLNPLTYIEPLLAFFSKDDNGAAASLDRELDKATERFLRKDLVVKGEVRSNIIHVSVTNPDRALSEEIARRLIDHFLEREATILTNPRLEFVRSQVEIYEKQAVDAQASLQHLKTSKKIFSLEEERTALIQQRSVLEQSLAAAEAHLAESRQRRQSLSQQLGQINPVVVLTQNDRDPLELSARSNLADLEARKARFANIYSDDSNTMVDLQARISSAQELLSKLGANAPLTHTDSSTAYQQIQISTAQAQADLEAARGSVEQQKLQLDAINRRFIEMANEESAYKDATRDNDLADQNYRAYLQGVQEARVSDDLNKEKLTSVAVYDPVRASTTPASPKRVKIMILATLGGLILAFALALLIEAMDETFNTPAQVTDLLGLPVVGSLAAR